MRSSALMTVLSVARHSNIRSRRSASGDKTAIRRVNWIPGIKPMSPIPDERYAAALARRKGAGFCSVRDWIRQTHVSQHVRRYVGTAGHDAHGGVPQPVVQRCRSGHPARAECALYVAQYRAAADALPLPGM